MSLYHISFSFSILLREFFTIGEIQFIKTTNFSINNTKNTYQIKCKISKKRKAEFYYQDMH